MSLFLETIKINNGRRINLSGHSQRMNFTRNRHFHEIRDIDLEDVVEVPEEYKIGIVKCRVTYGRKIEKVEFEDYHFKNPQTFQIVNADHIDYDFKYQDRTALHSLFEQKGSADDVLMIKNGLLTDTYYANVALLEDGKWYTPAEPLLKGTFRTSLLEENKVIERDIRTDEIYKYEKIKIYNAMTEWTMHEAIYLSDVVISSEI